MPGHFCQGPCGTQRWCYANRQQGTSGVEKQMVAVAAVVIIREERKKVKEDGRQKADVTRIWDMVLSFYQLNWEKLSYPSVSPILSIPILGNIQNPCQDLIIILATQTQGGRRHLLRKAQHSGALKRTTGKEVNQATPVENRLLLPGTECKGRLARTNTGAKGKTWSTAQQVTWCLGF